MTPTKHLLVVSVLPLLLWACRRKELARPVELHSEAPSVTESAARPKNQFLPLKASFQSLRDADPPGPNVGQERIPISDGVLSGYEEYLWHDGANVTEFIVKDDKVILVAYAFPKSSLSFDLTEKQKEFAEALHKTREETVDINLGIEPGAFFTKNARHALNEPDNGRLKSLHDEYVKKSIGVFKSGGNQYTFVDGYVFGCETGHDGFVRLELMSEGFCAALGVQACNSPRQ